MYDPSNRPNRPKALRENEETRRLMVENAQLRADLATALADLESRRREVATIHQLRDALKKARWGWDSARRRAKDAAARAAAAEDEARMCRFRIAELTTENRILLDRQVLACV